jgi:putative SOS response-associated peptidase YedK
LRSIFAIGAEASTASRLENDRGPPHTDHSPAQGLPPQASRKARPVTRGPAIARRAILAAMCGRAKLATEFSEIKVAFRVPPEYPTTNSYTPSWNVAPTDNLPIVRYNSKTASRTLDLMRWGLIPYWAKDMKIGFSTINAMAETIDTKPAFRDAFNRRRCLGPIEAFYEWRKLGPKDKQPYATALKGTKPMALAGLWENWKSPADEWVRSFTIITTSRTNSARRSTTGCR